MAITLQELETKFSGNTKSLDNAFSHVERQTGAHLTKVTNLYRNAQGRLVSESNAMASSWGGSGGWLPGLSHISQIIQGLPQIGAMAGAIIRPFTDAAQEGIRFNMILETSQIAFEGVTGSADKAHEHIQRMMAFGQKSPFRFEGLLEASQLMTAFGFRIDEQIPKLTIWGNAIAASGNFSAEAVQGVVTAFGQMSTSGRVNAQDMMQLTNRMIPGWELLAKAIGKSIPETRKLAEAGKLNGAAAVEAITAMMAIEPRYKGMMERLQKTLQGRMAEAQDTLQFGQGKATENLTKDLSDALGTALGKQNLVGELATNINQALIPVGALIKGTVNTVLGGGITAGLQDAFSAAAGVLPASVIKMAGDGILSPLKNFFGINSPSTVMLEMGDNLGHSLIMGFGDGLQKWAKEIEAGGGAAFIAAVEALCKRIGMSFDAIMNVMAFESNLTASEANPKSSARGLIQFMDSTSRGLGYGDSDNIAKMSAIQQLAPGGPVEKYFINYIKRGFELATTAQVYAAVAGPGARSDDDVMYRKGSKEYNANKIWDVNRDGVILARELALLAEQKGGFGKGGNTPTTPWYVSIVQGKPTGITDLTGGADQGVPVRVINFKEFGDPSTFKLGLGDMNDESPFKFTDVEWTAEKANLVVDRLTAAHDALALTNKLGNELGTVVMQRVIDGTNVWAASVSTINQDIHAAADGAGMWADRVLGALSITDRLRELEGTIPSVRAQFEDLVVGLPEQFGSIWAQNITNWEGGFRGMLGRMGQQLTQSLANWAAQLAASQITAFFTQMLTGLLGGAAGGVFGGGLDTNFGSNVGVGSPSISGGLGGGGVLRAAPVPAFAGREAASAPVIQNFNFTIAAPGGRVAPESMRQVQSRIMEGAARVKGRG